MKRRLVSVLLCLCMALTLLPTTAWAMHGLSITQQPGLLNDYTLGVHYTGDDPVSYQWYRKTDTPVTYTLVAGTPGEGAFAVNTLYDGVYADGHWTSTEYDGAYSLYFNYPAWAGDQITVTIPAGEAESIRSIRLFGETVQGVSGVYTATYEYSSWVNIEASASFTADVTIQRQWEAMGGETAAKLSAPAEGQTYLCVATAPDGRGGLYAEVSEEVTLQHPVAQVSWTEASGNKTLRMSADDLSENNWMEYLFDPETYDLLTDAATLTLLEDVALTDTLSLGEVNAALDGAGHTLTRDFDGGTSGDPMLGCGALSDHSPAAHRVTHVTLDGTYCGKEAASHPPTVVNVGKDSALTLGEGAAIVNGGQPPASKPNFSRTPERVGGVYVNEGGTLKLENGASVTDNRGAMAGGVYVKLGGQVELSGAVTVQGNTQEAWGSKQPSNLVLMTTDGQQESASTSPFAPIQITGSVAGGKIGVSRLAYESYTYKTALGVVAQGKGYTLTQDDLKAFFSDDPMCGLSLDVANNAIVLGELPPHVHAVGVDTTQGPPVTFEALGDTTTLARGQYFVEADKELTTALTIPADTKVDLCLNGHQLKYVGEDKSSVIQIAPGGTLNICDCDGSHGSHKVIDPTTDDEVTVEGGLITGGTGTPRDAWNSYGGGVYCQGALTLYGGTIAGNTTEYGGGVCARHENGASFTIHGGAVGYNAAESNGGVYVYPGENGNYGEFTMTGGEISHNKAGNNGGVNTIGSMVKFIMSGGSIHHNKAEESTGGARAECGVVQLLGGSITENTAAKDAGGISYGSSSAAKVTLGGDMTITGNTTAGKASDLLCSNICMVNVADNFTGQVGLRVEDDYYLAKPLFQSATAGGSLADMLSHFTPNEKGQFVEVLTGENDGKLALNKIAITQQPTADNDYTVATNGQPSGYQWYPIVTITDDVTDQNTVADDTSKGTYAEGKWTAAKVDETTYHYFVLDLKQGDTVKVTIPTAQVPSEGILYLQAIDSGFSMGYSYANPGFVTNNIFSVTEGDNTVITYVAIKNEAHRLWSQPPYAGPSIAPVVSATVTYTQLGDPIDGQTAKTLDTTSLVAGDYLCRVTWADGTVIDSHIVTYTPPHVHDWGKWTLLQDDYETLVRVCAGDNSHTESAKLSCGLPNASIVYDGTEKKPAPSLKASGDIGALAKDTDYTVAYKDNVNAGTGTVTITGKGDFDFTLEKAFTIDKATVDQSALPTELSFNISNRLAKEYVYSLTNLCPASITGEWGQRSYAIAKVEFTTDGHYTPDTARIDKVEGGTYANRLFLPILSNATDATGAVGKVTITVSSTNYADFQNTVIVKATNKTALTFQGDPVNDKTYDGQPYAPALNKLVFLADGENVTAQIDPANVLVTYAGRGATPSPADPTTPPTQPGQYTMTVYIADADENYIGRNAYNIEIKQLPGEAAGEVEVEPGTPEVSVDEDALKDLAGQVQPGQTVTVKLTVKKQEAPEDKDELESVISGQKDDVLYLDLALVKQVNDLDPEHITDTGEKVLEIAVPYDFTGKKDVTVYRKHGADNAAALAKLDARPAGDFQDGSFYADEEGKTVYIYASKFSTYAIGYTAKSKPVTPSGGSSGGGYVPPTVVYSPGGKTELPFTDVKTTDDFYDAVKYVYENKLMLGTSETTFEPQGELTRAMLATILYRAAGSPAVTGAPEFEDTLADAWYSDAIVWAAQTQVLRGYGNGKFGPEDPVSKEMMNLVAARQAGEDPVWVGDPALALPATRAEIAQTLLDQSKK